MTPARGRLTAAILVMADRMADAERKASLHRYSPTVAARHARTAYRRSRALERLVAALARKGDVR